MSTTYPQIWDLDSVTPYNQKSAIPAEFSGLKQRCQVLLLEVEASSAQKITNLPPAKVAQLLLEIEAVWIKLEDLSSLVGCLCAEDAENPQYRLWEGELASLRPQREELLTFLETSFGQLSDQEISQLAASQPEIGVRASYLRKCQAGARYRLPREMEALANALDVQGISAWERLYDYLSSKLRIPVMEKGKVVEKSPGQVSLDAEERTLRENNYHAGIKRWDEIAEPCALALNQISGSRLIRYQHLKTTDHLDYPLFKNRMARETLTTMWQTVTARKHKLGEYLTLKAELLGLEQLSWFDLQAPLAPVLGRKNVTNDTRISYNRACDEIVTCFQEFSPELGDFARMSLTAGWVEAENRSGKRQGGFCTTLPGYEVSRIFMTYTETRDSQSTLAHELGHAYHSYVMRDMPALLQDYPMNLAETASTFAETVMNEFILKHAPSDIARLLILDRMLQDSVSFLMNIHCRFIFEDRYHQLRKTGELSAEQFKSLMQEAQAEAYLGKLNPQEMNPQFWISKLHFYISGYPFYNFPYTFGYLLSQGLYKLGQQNKEDFPTQLRDFLRLTGSETAETCVLQGFGQDLTKPDFWNFVLDLIDARVDEFTRLIKTS
jgi:pepF/M3 family oligoendopeptidase